MDGRDLPLLRRPAPWWGVRPAPHVLVVGGGASGVLMAAHLLSRAERDFRVTIVERSGRVGRGLAYSTPDPEHLLNTRVRNMSAYPDRPEHFLGWLAARPEGAGADGDSFVSRRVYGAYLSDLLAPWRQESPARLRCVSGECLRLEEGPKGVVAHLSDGTAQIADLAVLATGHALPGPCPEGLLTDPWMPPEPAGGPVAILGSGLTMVDQVLSLLNAGHAGGIVALSRRGLLPRPHAPTVPLRLVPADIPLGAPASALAHWARRLAAATEAQGGDWRDAVDGIRPFVRTIWRGLPPEARARFLRHAAAWWEVHRHRMPPEAHARIVAALGQGRLRLVRGAFLGAECEGGAIALRYRAPGGAEATLSAARVIDCRGLRRDPEACASPLVADLLARGAARLDPLRLGLDVAQDCRLIGRDGRPSARLLAIGPASRAAFWEITAIPDIREQTAGLAAELAAC